MTYGLLKELSASLETINGIEKLKRNWSILDQEGETLERFQISYESSARSTLTALNLSLEKGWQLVGSNYEGNRNSYLVQKMNK